MENILRFHQREKERERERKRVREIERKREKYHRYQDNRFIVWQKKKNQKNQINRFQANQTTTHPLERRTNQNQTHSQTV